MLLLVLAACATVHEAAGNRALKAGDQDLAVSEYGQALQDVPMMDFEYARIRDKRKKLVEGQWAPQFDAVVSAGATESPLDYASALIDFRRTARDEATTKALAARIDAELLRVTTPDVLAVTNPAAVLPRLDALTALLDQAVGKSAPQAVVDQVAAAWTRTVTVGLPPVTPEEGPARLAKLLSLRGDVRSRGLPVAADEALQAELSHIVDAPLTPSAGADPRSDLSAALALAADARHFGAPPNAVALADHIVYDADARVIAAIDDATTTHQYLATYDAYVGLAGGVQSGDPLRARLTGLANQGAAYYTAQAAALPAGYRRYLQLALAAQLGGGPERAAAMTSRTTFDRDIATSLALKVAPSDCRIVSAIAARLPAGTTTLQVQLAFSDCLAEEGDSTSTRSDTYTTDEVYYEDEEVQTGTDIVQVQTGTHQEQCTQDSSLGDGSYWSGLCDVPDYQWEQVPIMGTQSVEKHRPVSNSMDYDVTTHTVEIAMDGAATATWPDGTVVTVPFSSSVNRSADAYNYTLPDESGPVVHEQAIPADLDVAHILPGVASEIADNVASSMTAQVRALRAQLARQDGTHASEVGDDAAAGEAFVRSVLIDGHAEGDAAPWIATASGVSAVEAEGALTRSPSGSSLPSPAGIVAAEAWSPAPTVVAADNFDELAGNLESDVKLTTESYNRGIRPPNEFENAHAGLAPFEIQTGAMGARVTPAIGLRAEMSPLEMLKLRYGLVIHDQLDLNFSMGMLFRRAATGAVTRRAPSAPPSRRATASTRGCACRGSAFSAG